jgi:hypothetical protein
MAVYRSFEAALKAVRGEIEYRLDIAARLTMNNQGQRLTDVTKKWKNKLVFRLKLKPSVTGTKYQMVAEGSGNALRIFGYVDKGTDAHVILPKNGRYLRFRTGYSALTAPIANANAGSGKATGPEVFSRGVIHPGIKAREFIGWAALEAEEEMLQRIKEIKSRVGE